MEEIKQCANNKYIKKIVDNFKENTYYYFVYIDSTRPYCIIRKFKNAIWKEEKPYCSIYDIENFRPITLLPNSEYDIVQNKDYIYVKFSIGYAGVFYITKSLQTAHNILKKECRGMSNLMYVSPTKFYKDCIKQLKEFVTIPSMKETRIATDYSY